MAITPVFCCGAECGRIGGIGQHWQDVAGAPTIATAIKRSGDRSLRFNPTAGFSIARNTVLTSSDRWVWRFYLYFTSLPTSNTRIMATLAGGSEIFFQQSTSKLFASQNLGTILGATGAAVTTGVQYRIDVKADMSANPWLMDVSVDGVALGQASWAIGAGGVQQFDLGCLASTTADFYIDDVVASHTLADYPIGNGYINHFVPTADGTHNVAGAMDFRKGDTTTDITNATTTAYQLVDDVPLDDTTPDADDHIRIVAPPNGTDYVELVFGPAPGISTPTVAPRAVEVIVEVFAAGTGLSDEIVKLNDNGTVDNVYDGTQVAGTTTGIYKRKHYATAPTGGAWTVVAGAGNFNNIRLRYGYATDANPDKSLMCAMIEAEFAPVVIERIPKPIIVRQAVQRAAVW